MGCGTYKPPSKKTCANPGKNLLYNGAFSQGMSGWMSDTTNYIGSSGGNGGPGIHNGGLHLHNNCQTSYGGAKQMIPNLVKGVTYTLKFDGWGGDWDGDENDSNRGRYDTDTVWVHADGQQFSDSDMGQTTQGSSQGLTTGQRFTHTFVATGGNDAFMSFWSARSNCFDIDNVQLTCGTYKPPSKKTCANPGKNLLYNGA